MSEVAITIVRVPVEQKTFDPDAVDAQIYCINTGNTPLSISFRNESFTTIDEETGLTASHGTDDHSFVLNPDEVKLIAVIQGWEWDGHVGMEIECKPLNGGTPIVQNYNFKSGSGDYTIESLSLTGRIMHGT